MVNPRSILSALAIVIASTTGTFGQARGIWMYELDVKIVEETNGSFALEYVQFYLTIPDRSSHFVCETGETDSPISDMDRMQGECYHNGANPDTSTRLAFEVTHSPTIVEVEEEGGEEYGDGFAWGQMRLKPYGALSMRFSYMNATGEEISNTFIALNSDYLRPSHYNGMNDFYFHTQLVPRNSDLQYAEL